jgi:hypothetical protein
MQLPCHFVEKVIFFEKKLVAPGDWHIIPLSV